MANPEICVRQSDYCQCSACTDEAEAQAAAKEPTQYYGD